jgi:hypothetical protein
MVLVIESVKHLVAREAGLIIASLIEYIPGVVNEIPMTSLPLVNPGPGESTPDVTFQPVIGEIDHLFSKIERQAVPPVLKYLPVEVFVKVVVV